MAAAARNVARLDAVGDDGGLDRPQVLHAADGQPPRADALDLGAALHQHLGERGDVGLDGHVVERGDALGEHRGHHQLRGRADRDHAEVEVGALEPHVAPDDVAVLDLEVRVHRVEALEVQVDGARAPGAAAGQRDARGAEAREQRAQHVDAGAHGAHQVVGRLERADVRGVHDAGVAVEGHLRPEGLEHAGHGARVGQQGHVAQRVHAGGEQRGGHERQGRVLRPADLHAAGEPLPPANDQGVHGLGPRVFRRGGIEGARIRPGRRDIHVGFLGCGRWPSVAMLR